MKKNLFLGLFLMISVFAFAQVSEAEADKAFKIIDEANNQLAYKGDYSCTVSLVIEKPGKPKENLQFKFFERIDKELFTMVQLFPDADKGNGYLKEGDNIVSDLHTLKTVVSDLKNYKNNSKGKYKNYELEYSDCKYLLNSLGFNDCYISIEVIENAPMSSHKHIIFVWIMHGKDVVARNRIGSDDYTNLKTFIKEAVVPLFNDYKTLAEFLKRK